MCITFYCWILLYSLNVDVCISVRPNIFVKINNPNWDWKNTSWSRKSKLGLADHWQGSVRPSFDFEDRVRDWNFWSLNFVTGSETQIFWVSVSRLSPRLKFSESQFRDRVRDSNFLSLNFETESETVNFRVSISRPSPRLNFSSLSFETESETNIFLVSISRPGQ